MAVWPMYLPEKNIVANVVGLILSSVMPIMIAAFSCFHIKKYQLIYTYTNSVFVVLGVIIRFLQKPIM